MKLFLFEYVVFKVDEREIKLCMKVYFFVILVFVGGLGLENENVLVCVYVCFL